MRLGFGISQNAHGQVIGLNTYVRLGVHQELLHKGIADLLPIHGRILEVHRHVKEANHPGVFVGRHAPGSLYYTKTDNCQESDGFGDLIGHEPASAKKDEPIGVVPRKPHVDCAATPKAEALWESYY
jgi:hypothetical protein